MKFLDKFIKKSTETASIAVRDEVRKTAFNIFPHIFGIASLIFGTLIFKENKGTLANRPPATKVIRSTRVINTNYFFSDMNEETIKKIINSNRRRR